MFDIQDKISEVAQKIKKDPKLLADFKDEPIQVVEKLLGVDLPDTLIEKVADGVKAALSDGKIDKDDLGGAVDLLKKLF